MFNPFVDNEKTTETDESLVARAKTGDRHALEAVVRRHQGWIYNIAVRMVYDAHEAEEVTQEVLIKVVTKLSTFQGRSRFRTWLYRIVTNHVINMKLRGAEQPRVTYKAFQQCLTQTPDAELPDPRTVPVDVPLLVEEAMAICTTAMLLCLDRRQRLVFVLGEVFAVRAAVGAEIMDVTPANFRQILSRARRDLYSFMNGQCGLVSPGNPCHCRRKMKAFIESGGVDPHHLRFADPHVKRVREMIGPMQRVLAEASDKACTELFHRSGFLDVPDQVAAIRTILADQSVLKTLDLDARISVRSTDRPE